MNPFKGYWIVLKDIWIFSRTCQSFLDTKQPSCLNHHIFGNTITAFAKLVVFVLGFHITVVSFICHVLIHTSHSIIFSRSVITASFILILILIILSHLFAFITLHSVAFTINHTIALTWSSRFWFVSLVCDIIVTI